MLKFFYVGIILGTLFMLPSNTYSQTDVFLGPHLGMQKSGDAEKMNYLVGATIRAKLAPALGVEMDVGYRQQKYGNDVLTVKDWPVTVTGLIYPLPMIYGGVGAGWYNSTLDYADRFNEIGYGDETAQKFGWHLAAGVEVEASPKVNLYGDVRYVFLKYKFRNLPGAVLDGANSDFYSINIGLLFRL